MMDLIEIVGGLFGRKKEDLVGKCHSILLDKVR
jgi:hypothetical protein